MNRFSLRRLCLSGILAALYAALTLLTAPMAFGLVQFRLAEALVALCALEPGLWVGLTAGCFFSNLFSTATALDALLGTLATALACLWTGRSKLVVLPNVLVNGLVVGGMLAWVLFPENWALGFLTAASQVAFGELVVMALLGLPLYRFVRRTNLLQRP